MPDTYTSAGLNYAHSRLFSLGELDFRYPSQLGAQIEYISNFRSRVYQVGGSPPLNWKYQTPINREMAILFCLLLASRNVQF